MVKIESYTILWNADTDDGNINLLLEGGAARMVSVDSAAECSLLIDILRNEDPVYIHARHNQIITGMEPIGEGKEDSNPATDGS